MPIILYGEFRDAEAEKQALLLDAVRDKGLIIGRPLSEVLVQADEIPFVELANELARFASDQIRIKLLFQPIETGTASKGGFFYVAAAPPVSTEDLDLERQSLKNQGILQRLESSCEGDVPLAILVPRKEVQDEILTSITPVQTNQGCWALVISHSSQSIAGVTLGEPYWKSREIQLALIIYVAMALLVIGLFLALWRSLRRFGRLAATVQHTGAAAVSFAGRNTVPELTEVARSLDGMVGRLRSAALGIRRAAEDNAHAFKTPLGVIQQALEPLKRRVSAEDERGQQALRTIGTSLGKLEGLVASAQRLDQTTADLLDLPQRPVNLSQLTEQLVEGYRATAAEAQVELIPSVGKYMIVRGSLELLETVLENIVDNAISFSPQGGRVWIGLTRKADKAMLNVEDEGPGVPGESLQRIFDRYFSDRPAPHGDGEIGTVPESFEGHFGIGLWIVRRNVEALGGTVEAANRADRGFLIRVTLPLSSSGTAALAAD